MSKISLIRNLNSPNFDQEEIPVEFVVLHYTACSIEKTMEIFLDKSKKVAAHFVIGEDGALYDLGNFWHGKIRRGAHAGESYFESEGRKWEKFNDFSIGIELVNCNGNLKEYSQAQYRALKKVISHLSRRFVNVNDPERIVGHEQIAGFRGKVDPGIKFDWAAFFQDNFPKSTPPPERKPVLTADLLAMFERSQGKLDLENLSDDEWTALSSKLETFAKSVK